MCVCVEFLEKFCMGNLTFICRPQGRKLINYFGGVQRGNQRWTDEKTKNLLKLLEKVQVIGTFKALENTLRDINLSSELQKRKRQLK